jgi:hypothetical protein
MKIMIQKTVILPVIFYECETWYRTLREEQKLQVSENKLPTKLFTGKKAEVGQY